MQSLKIFAGWNPEDFTIVDGILIVFFFVLFVFILIAPGLYVLIKANDAKKISANTEYSSGFRDYHSRIARTRFIIGVFLVALPFLYFRFDTNMKESWEVITYSGSFYELDLTKVARLSTFDFEFDTDTPELTNYRADTRVSAEDYDKCARIIDPQISCFPFEHTSYGRVYVDNEVNILNQNGGSILIRSNNTTMRLFTPRVTYNKDSKISKQSQYWQTMQPFVDLIEEKSKWKRLLECW